MSLANKPAHLGGLLKTIAVVNDLSDRVETLEGSGPVELQTDVSTLQDEVETASTGLLDRATALEARASFLSGSGAPGGGLGANGDLYLDTAASEFYLKAGGSWGSMGTLTVA